jgi:hypothetical protein
VTLRTASAAGATVQLRLDGAQGPVLARVVVPAGKGWREVKAPLTTVPAGTHALFVVPQSKGAAVEIDWVRFE